MGRRTGALRKGEQLLRSGQFAAAIPPLEDAAQRLSHSSREVQAQVYNYLGLAYHGAGDAPHAARAYEAALKLDRNLAESDYNLGCLDFEQKNYPAAVDASTTYITLRPKLRNGFLVRGSAFLHLARW